MNIPRILDGKLAASETLAGVAEDAAEYLRMHGTQIGLAVVLIGDDPASNVYVRNKAKQTLAAGMRSFEHRLPAETRDYELLALVRHLNNDPAVHGILVQLPLPPHIDARKIIEAIDPVKDVDGFHPINAGRLAIGQDALVPCTPQGCVILAKRARPDLTGLHAVIIGRSNIVGKPLAHLLLNENCTVTIAHSQSKDLAFLAREADLLIAAAGRPELVRCNWVKSGAIVIDVGINRVAGHDGKGRLVGDVAFDEVKSVAGWITPVPGGVGPMTIACLLANTIKAAKMALALGRCNGAETGPRHGS